jgi:hypothetical protein
MGVVQDLINAGYGGYAGWGDAEAAADFNAGHGDGKKTNPGGGSGRSSVPAFSFDYEGEAKKAYGELGTYYGRLLNESQGDVKLALARLVEDYNRGLRIKTEDKTRGEAQANTAEVLGRQRVQNNAIARGLYSQSQFVPNPQPDQGFGVADQMLGQTLQPINQRRTDLLTSFSRYKEGADVAKARKEIDIPEKQKRYEANLEQQRRKESAAMANDRGQRAYQDYLAKLNQF